MARRVPVLALVPPLLFAVIWIAALANIGFGIAPGLPLELSSAAAADLLGHLP